MYLYLLPLWNYISEQSSFNLNHRQKKSKKKILKSKQNVLLPKPGFDYCGMRVFTAIYEIKMFCLKLMLTIVRFMRDEFINLPFILKCAQLPHLR